MIIVKKRRDLLALAIIVIAVSLLHWRGIMPGQTFLPVDLANNIYPWRDGPWQPLHNPLISDPLYSYYPYLDFSVETLRTTGQWPLWNPYILLGHPVIADPVAQPFYPVFTLLGLILGAARGLSIGFWLHAVVAGLLAYAWMRALGFGRRAALLGAIVYAAGGQMVTWFGARQWVSTLTWLPGVLWAFELWLTRRRWAYLALATLFQGLALLSGQYQIWLAFSLFLGLYALLRTAEEQQARRRVDLSPLAAAATVVVVGGLLAAIQLLPSIEYLGLSHRASVRLIGTAMNPVQLISLLVPNFFGNPVTTGDYWGQFNYSEAIIYAGLVPLLLAIMAPITVRRRRFLALGFSLLTLIVIYLIVGGPGIERFQDIPGLQYLGLVRSAFLLSLLIAPLAAMTLDEAPRSPWPVLAAALALLGVAALAIALNWGDSREHWADIQRPVQRAGLLLLAATGLLVVRATVAKARVYTEWLLVGLTFVDLFIWGHDFNPAGPIDQLLPPNEATVFIQAAADEHRVAPIFLGWELAFGPNVLSTFGVAEPGGYASLVSARLRDLFAAGDPDGQHWNILSFHNPSLRLLDLFQVGYLASPVPMEALVERAEVLQMACSERTAEISADEPISGRFTAIDSAINRIDFKFHILTEDAPDGDLWIRLWQGDQRERLVLEARQPVAELYDGQEVSWYFTPERDAPGRVYVWEVKAAEGVSRTGVGLCASEDGQPALAVYGRIWQQVFEDGIFYQQRLAPMPRAYVTYAADVVVSEQETVERLLDPTFDLRNSALVAEPVNLPGTAARPASPATLVEYGQSRVVVDATASEAGLLILGDLWHPGWQVTVDGQPAELLRANHVLRAVMLPAGQHRVEFRFQPRSLRHGVLISLGALLIVAGLAALDRRQRTANR